MQDQSARYLELKVEAENGLAYVHSKHVPGLHLIGKSFQSMKSTLEEMIVRLFKDNENLNVKVYWLTEHSADAMCKFEDDVLKRLAVFPLTEASAA
jgi:hypothetical protein